MDSSLKKPSDWFAAARIMATVKMPYFTTGILALAPFECPGLKTMGVTQRGVLLWDPDLSQVWTIEEAAWTILHEVCHFLRNHAQRAQMSGVSDPMLHQVWNYATDAEIDDDLVAGGATYPKIDGKFLDESMAGKPVHYQVLPSYFGCPDGRLAEEYYQQLRKQMPKMKQGCMHVSGDGSGAGKQSGKGKGSSGSGQGQRGRGNGKNQPGDGQEFYANAHGGKHGCGSGAGGETLAAEADVPKEMGKSQAEQRRVQRAVAEAVRRAAEKGRGDVPLGVQRWAEETLGTPRVPWQQKLARACRAAVAYRPGAGDYRYDRPSRRQGAFGYGTGSPVFPALRMPVPKVAIAVDTSGSMGDEELKTALEESKGILAAVGADVTFLTCDAAIHGVKRVRNVKEAMAAMLGGGGTDFRPVFDAVKNLPQRPELLVFITDGMGPAPEAPPHAMHVIWLLVGPHRVPPCKWGEVVELDSERDEKQSA